MAANDSFGARRLFLADARLALAIANEVRHQVLERGLGIPRAQSNVVIAALALTAADAAYEAARRVARAGLPGVSATDAAVGGFAVRGAALGLAGPAGKDVPLLGSLMVFAILGGLAAPGLRHAASRARATEARVRSRRIEMYQAASRARARPSSLSG